MTAQQSLGGAALMLTLHLGFVQISQKSEKNMTNVGEKEKKPRLGIKEAMEVHSFLKSWYDLEFKTLAYLMAAHAAGLIVCLSALKDYKDSPQLKGIGIFIILFGLGLILSALAFMTLAAGIERIFRLVLHSDAEAERQTEIKIMAKFYIVIAILSAIIFIVAIGIGIYRFGGL